MKEEYTYKQRTMQTLGCALIVLVFLFIDLLTKLLMTGVHQNEYFLGIVRINFMFNTGIAFGIAADNPVAMIVVTILTFLLIGGMIALYFTVFKHNLPVRVCLAIVLAGALGNLFDRLYFSIFGATNVPSSPGKLYYGAAVRDFIDVSPLHFGVCNIADFCITFGAVALAFSILFIGPRSVFPLTKKWRAEGKRLDEEAEAKKNGFTGKISKEPIRPSQAEEGAFEEVVVFSRTPSEKKQPPKPSPAQPQAAPKSTPAAKPATQPKSTPAAKPAPQPKATPAAKPATQPKATPAAKPAAQPKAAPAVKPAPQPKTTPAAKPVTQPKAAPAPQPKAAPKPPHTDGNKHGG